MVLSAVLETISFTLANQIHPSLMDVALTLHRAAMGSFWVLLETTADRSDDVCVLFTLSDH